MGVERLLEKETALGKLIKLMYILYTKGNCLTFMRIMNVSPVFTTIACDVIRIPFSCTPITAPADLPPTTDSWDRCARSKLTEMEHRGVECGVMYTPTPTCGLHVVREE